MAKPKLRIIPLGGLGEIGKNMMVYELGDDAIIVDSGIMFPANDMHGVDYIIPDFSYLTTRPNLKIHGFVYTHGHEDHIGAVAHVAEAFPGVPVYGTPLTAGLIEVKLKEAKLHKQTPINVFQAGDILQVGPFKLESFRVTHSIPDCVGFGINTPYGIIVMTGDYKFDNTPVDGKKTDYARLASFSRRGVLLLLADSTNADKPGWTPSEAVIDGALNRVFQQSKGRIMVATFASVISRVQQVANAALRHNRRLAIGGYSMSKNVDMAREMGYLDIPDRLLIDINKVHSLPKDKVVMMVTGTQGEPSAILGRLSQGRHRQLDVEPGDTIILSSHPIPGNEEMVYRTINKLIQRGANVIYDPIELVHVSGHARQEEMKLMINLVSPKYMMPVHGELRHLVLNGKMAMEQGIPEKNIFVVENGHVIEVDNNGVRVGERVPGGYVFVDGSGVGDVGRAVIRDREILARDGFLIVSVNVDRQSGQMIGEPNIISRGFVYLREADELLKQVKDIISSVMGEKRSHNGKRRDQLEESISRKLYNETKRRPMIFSIINEV